MTDAPELLLALVNAVDGREDEFANWYRTTHIPEVLALPGFRNARPYDAASSMDVAAGYRFATVYEIDGSAAEARNRLYSAGLGTSDSMDMSRMLMIALRPADAEGSM